MIDQAHIMLLKLGYNESSQPQMCVLQNYETYMYGCKRIIGCLIHHLNTSVKFVDNNNT